jgi:Ca2+-binding EF-hand superfamily protein
MSAQLRQEEIDELRAAFDSFDADGSGSISHDELAKMLTQISPHQRLTKDQIILMVKTFDKNGMFYLHFHLCWVLLNQKRAHSVTSLFFFFFFLFFLRP